MNIRAVPTFVIGGRVLTGLYDADVLERVIEEELEQEKRGNPRRFRLR